jgi:hypothetical protein
MPPKPRWYANIPQIRRRLETMPESCPLDRKAVEMLFGVKARQANNLMIKFAGYAVGQSIALSRTDLLARIDEMSGPSGVARAVIQEKRRAVSYFNAEERKVRPKKIPLPPPKPVGAPLPAGVRLVAAGQILIEFTDPEELLSRNLALSQSAITDFASFAAGLEYGHPRNGDCTVDNPPPTTPLAVTDEDASS